MTKAVKDRSKDRNLGKQSRPESNHDPAPNKGQPKPLDLPGWEVMEALGWHAGLEYIDRDLAAMYGVYKLEGRDSAELALQAINEIANHQWNASGRKDEKFGGIDPNSNIGIPWWVIFAISVGWSEYVDARGTLRLGQAFGVEGTGGKGAHRRLTRKNTWNRRWGYALEIAWEVHLKKTGAKAATKKDYVTQAMHEVAERWNVSYDTVRSAWKQHGKRCQETVKNGVKRS